MENLRLTIQEAQEILLMSQSSVYAWIDKGKLQTEESPNGKIIVISNKEANQIREMNLKSKRNKASKQILQNQQNSDQFQEIPTISAEFYRETSSKNSEIANDNITFQLVEELKNLAIEAGKYKQLEIIRNEEKDKFEFWQSKYFELSAELNAKNLEIEALKKQIAELEEKTKKTFFGIKLY